MRLLFIEDEIDLAEPLVDILEREGFVVDFVDNGKDGLELLNINSYDCVLLDLNLPGIDGISLAKKLRQEHNTIPIIMVTARSQVYDKLEGFESGADDYITKPFNSKELIARIYAIIKRNSLNKDDFLGFGRWKFFPKKNLAKSGDRTVRLTNKETGILEYLLRRRGEIISSEELLEHVWGDTVDLLTDTVKTHIKTIRKKIDPDKEFIVTVRGKGYRLRVND